ncbi:MAG TPA: ABC transporter permease [Thermoplasmata archaeon]
MATSAPAASAPPGRTGGRRPSPRIAQLRRTFFFLSRNTLAMIGLGILLFFVVVAVYSFTDPSSGTSLDQYCGTYGGPGAPPFNGTPGCVTVCTYDSTTPPPGPNCYGVDHYSPGFVPPTVDVTHLSAGPMPLGSLTLTPGSPLFYSIYQGELKGAPWSLGISAGIVLSGAAIGLALGSIAGYAGGYTDELVMRITDIFLSIPGLLLVLVLLAVLGSTFTSLTDRVAVLMGAFIVTWWPLYTRIVRGQVLVTREQKYVEASKASGARSWRILGRHIVPNSLFPVFVQVSLDVGAIPLLLGALVFLGFHIFPSQYFPEWGSISANAILIVPAQLTFCGATSCNFPWWQLVFPGLIIFLFAISVNFLSDGLRDALDPRLRR